MSDQDPAQLPEHVAENRKHWDEVAHEWVAAGRKAWESAEPYWGCWELPESQLQLLPEDMSDIEAIELGCGTGYVSGWMHRRGAAVTGIDNSQNQLASARSFAEEFAAELELIHGNAEQVPKPDGSYDFAFSEYGAAIWCDPFVWIPEAHRLLRPGGELVFLAQHPLVLCTTPPSGALCEPTLHRDYFGLHRLDWRDVEIDPGGIDFTLPIGEWIRLFHRTGFEILDYLELQAPADLEGNPFHGPSSWGERWPYEHVWKLRKRD